MNNPSDPYRHHYQHAQLGTASSAPPTLPATSPHSLIPSFADLYGSGFPRHQHSMSAPSRHHPMSRSPGSPSVGPYRHPYAASSASPSAGLAEFQSVSDQGMPNTGISPTQMSASSSSAQRRAYRQRRKDPSCDACRERKVKCDATETSSCSECSSRNVKCQFTKETNRRMSSIKQVQDLQSQLNQYKDEVSKLQKRLRDQGTMEVDRNPIDVPTLSLPEIHPNQERRLGPPTMNNFDHVRKNLRIYGRGIFKPPPLYRQIPPAPTFLYPLPDPPPKEATDRLLAQYYNSIHRYYPTVHWPTFQYDVERVYTAGSFQVVNQSWMSLFFAVLACGTLNTLDRSPNAPRQDTDGLVYLETCLKTVNTWNDDLPIDQALTALLCCIFVTELNVKSAGWVWLGSAVRISQDIGLHCETGPWPPIEQEVRRRTWWAIYAWDRLISLESGRPLLIDDEDCDVGWPTPVDDRCIQSHGLVNSPPGQSDRNFLAGVIPVVRFVSQLKKTLKARVIAPATLKTYDDYFHTVATAFPEPYGMQSNEYLDPPTLHAALTLQIARFHLYRHNLSAACSQPERTDAMRRCLAVAQDTVNYIARSSQLAPDSSSTAAPAPGSPTRGWRQGIASTASNSTCTHLWRCSLILAFSGDWLGLLHCLQCSAAIGDVRRINLACGRNLAFFLDRLSERIHAIDAAAGAAALQQHLDADEELLAYVSGDMQGSPEESWVWTGSETGIKLNHAAAAATGGRAGAGGAMPAPLDPGVPAGPGGRAALGADLDVAEWGGWERIERVAQTLREEQQHRLQREQHRQQQQQQQQQQQHLQGPPPPSLPPMQHPQQPPHGGAAGGRLHPASGQQLLQQQQAAAASGSVSPNSSSRISIKNII